MRPGAYLAAVIAAAALAACGAGLPKTRPGEITGEVSYADAMQILEGKKPEQTALVESHTLTPTLLAGELAAIGLDPKKLPPLEKLPEDTKKKVMPLLAKSLGIGCTECHAASDYKTETRDMKIARRMWNDFLVPLTFDAGKGKPAGLLFCDSCHGGARKVLARKDQDRVRKFMDDDYVQMISRKDGEEHGCATCHDSFQETKIIEKLWNIPPAR